MPSPKRSAPRRTVAALAEDLVLARKVGGLQKAGEDELATTVDFLSLAGVSPAETPLSRARDLLVSYVRRGCQLHEQRNRTDKAAQAAAASLGELLLRPGTDRRIAQTIRRQAAAAAGHRVSPDAVRHREDKIIDEIAQAVFADLQVRRMDEPQTVEAGIHRIMPIGSDLRQDLHDLLCMCYMNAPPRSIRERRIIEATTKEVVTSLVRLLVASVQLAAVGVRTANMTEPEFAFVNRARRIRGLLFEKSDDRALILGLVASTQPGSAPAVVERLLATVEGRAAYARAVEWLGSCFPTCAFERSTEVNLMCEPHELVTILYDMENEYTELGFSELNIVGNIPMLHHRINSQS